MTDASFFCRSLRGMLWSATGGFLVRCFQFAFGVALARLLPPSDFGVIGLLGLFLALSTTLADCGFSAALVRKPDRSSDDCVTVLLFSTAVSLCVYAALFAAAPAIAAFFRQPVLEPVVRVMALGVVFGALRSVPLALLRIRLAFRLQAAVDVAAMVGSGAAGVLMALRGLGVWALVGQGLVWHVLSLVLTWAASRWRPRGAFSGRSCREFFSFGWRHLGSSLIDSACGNLPSLVIGRLFGVAQLGLFSRADSWTQLPAQIVEGAAVNVNYPLFAAVQNDRARLAAAYHRVLLVCLAVLVAAASALVLLARPLVWFLLGEAWLPAAGLIGLLSPAVVAGPLSALAINLLYVRNRPDLALRLELVKKPIALGLLAAGLFFGVPGVCLAKSIASLVALAVNVWCAERQLASAGPECRVS